jgi:hypothetical protein
VVAGIFATILSLLLNRLGFTPFLRRRTPPYRMIIVRLAIALIIRHLLFAVGGPNFFR